VYGLVHAVRVGIDGSVLLDVSEEEVVVEEDGPLMSVVTGGLVLVIVAVVVGVDGPVAVAENVGSMKFCGACAGSLNWRLTNVTAANRIPIAARPAALAPTTADVR
jgi:ABC-type Co2+ transport system permease subunit